MKISLSWLKTHIHLSESPEEIDDLLTNSGLEVEDLYELGSVKGGLKGLVVGQVMEVIPHPNADRLRITKVDIGSEVWLNIVCGAPNVAIGQKVVVAPIGTTIYSNEGSEITMKKAKIRGENSEGMICAEDEIGLGNAHDGIMVLDSDCQIGKPIIEYVQTDLDHIIEIGLTPNRGDAASHIGVARELKALLKRPLIKSPLTGKYFGNNDSAISVSNTNAALCGRYSGLTVQNVSPIPSPDWLVKRLQSIGIQSINALVDVTNFIMHDMGQPMHAFDAEKIKGELKVRLAQKGESLVTLDKIERKLQGLELLIADDQGPLALAGVMGGLSSAISDTTKNIFIESAWFDPAMVRKTAKTHTLNTDSSFRFERGIDPENTVLALEKAAQILKEIFPEASISKPLDIQTKDIENPKVYLSYKKLNTIIGTVIDINEVKSILTHLEIEIVTEDKEGLNLSIPVYRSDVTRDIDVIEDILRIHGFNNIPFPRVLHSAAVVQSKPDKNKVKQTICDFLSNQGFHEIMSNSLTSKAFFTEEQVQQSVNLLNPLSNDLSILRPDLMPSLLQAILYNKNRKSSDLKLYEIGKTYKKNENGYFEIEKLGMVVTGLKTVPNWINKPIAVDYFYFKGLIKNLLVKLGIPNAKVPKILQVDKETLKRLDLSGKIWYIEFNLDSIYNAIQKKEFILEEIPVFPEVQRDLNLIFEQAVAYQELEKIVQKNLGKYYRKMTLSDVYEGKPLKDGQKSFTLNIVLYDSEKTMNDKQIDAIMQKLITTFENQLNAIIRKQ